jgi:cell division protein ZapA
MKQIEVTIVGQSYMLACPEDGEALLEQAVALVDKEMSAIRRAGKVKARERIAVLAALNLAYQHAEITASAQAPPGAEAKPPLPAQSGTEPGSEAAGDAEAIGALIQRIDQALGAFGHLI